MRSRFSFRLLSVLALLIAGMAFGVTQVSAHGGGHGKGHWAHLDTDGDGASDRCEIQAGTDRNVADSDGDGSVDGLEDSDGDGANNAAESRLKKNCGEANTRFKIRRATVDSFADGKLTLKIGSSGLITAPVSANLVCLKPDPDDDDDANATVARHGHRGKHRGRRGGDDRGRRHGHGRHRGDHDHDDFVACTTAELTAGTKVKSAKIKRGEFVKIRLADND